MPGSSDTPARRQHKTPSKFNDCILGEELNSHTSVNDPSDIEVPIVHEQSDGKTNNVSFKIMPQRIEKWKQSVKSYFGDSKISTLNKGAVLKVLFDSDSQDEKNKSVKMNFYKSGSVVIQGPRCSDFCDRYFNELKLRVDNSAPVADTIIDVEETIPKTVESPMLDSPMSPIIQQYPSRTDTVETPVYQTPVTDRSAKTDRKLTPQERVNLHSKSLDNKLSAVHIALGNIDSAIISLSETINELTNTSANIPSFISDSLTVVKKRIKESFDEIDSKVKHQSGLLDSVHVKLNLLDSKVKTVDTKQDQMNETISKMFDMISALHDKFNNTENHPNDEWSDTLFARRMSSVQDEQPLNTDIQVQETSNRYNNNEDPTNDEDIQIQNNPEATGNSTTNTMPRESLDRYQPWSNENSEQPEPVIITECDNLILSDSMLRRISPKRFTPRQNTIKKFISGGSVAGLNYIEKYGKSIKPKKVIIHIGTRDLPNDKFDQNVFTQMIGAAVNVWSEAKIFVLPLIQRKDIPHRIVNYVNGLINTACETHKVKVLEPFEPDSDMYYDQIHLNDKAGLPALIRHIKQGMSLSTYQYRANKQPRNNPHRVNPHAGNHTQDNLEYGQERQTQPMTASQNFPPVPCPSLSMSSSAGNQSSFNHNMGINSSAGSQNINCFPANPSPQQLAYQNIPNFTVNPWFIPTYNTSFPPLTQTNVQNVPWINPWASNCGLNTN